MTGLPFSPPSETFSWSHLAPTVTAVANGPSLTTFTISGGFVGNLTNGSGPIAGGSVLIDSVVDGILGGLLCSVTLPASAQPTTVSCQGNESLASAESNGLALGWSDSHYEFNSIEGVPVSLYWDTSIVETYNATNAGWS